MIQAHYCSLLVRIVRMNPRLDALHPYPFEKLRQLLAPVTVLPAGIQPINLSIGEPKHAAPPRIERAITESLSGLSVYPATRGEPALRRAIAEWLGHRYSIPTPDADAQVLPVAGSREALFAFAQALIDDSKGGYVISPNPFYQIYEGAAILAGVEPYQAGKRDVGVNTVIGYFAQHQAEELNPTHEVLEEVESSRTS